MGVCCALAITPAVDGEEAMPVILLTGFEPFGDGRPPNPSWEGIRALDGQPWRGYQLAARRLPVVWGAPRKHLEPWLEELKPVAVFSFGQGGGYKLEIHADNRRGDGQDNNGDRPPQREIVASGPATFAATINAKAIVDDLTKRDYRVGISREAGNYLCEECLYTLEYLKQRDQRQLDVLFCHLPPLKEDKYEPADVERFVMALLEAWHATHIAAPK